MVALVRRNGGRDQVTGIQRKPFPDLQGGTQVTTMDGIEGSAEQTDSHDVPHVLLKKIRPAPVERRISAPDHPL
jgi:hypothetical protein